MSTILTCLEQAFEAILDDPSLFLDEEFMMERMFEPITSKIPPLREYLEHIFEIKSAMNVNNQRVDAVLLDMLRAALFYPTRDDIIQTNNFCLELAVVISTRLLQ
jgi:dihydroorotase